MEINLPRERYINSDNLNIHIVEWGDSNNQPVILLHHVSSQARTWDNFASSISDNYYVIAIDMRGHGDSDWANEGEYTTEHYAYDVEQIANNMGLKNIIVIGGSLGGRVGLVFASKNPSLVHSIIMEDVGAVRPATIAQGFADRIASGDPEFTNLEECANVLKGNNTLSPYSVFQHQAKYLTKINDQGKYIYKRDPNIQKDFIPLALWDYVKILQAPLMLMIGDQSSIVGEDQQKIFKELLPNIVIKLVANAGHIIVRQKGALVDLLLKGVQDTYEPIRIDSARLMGKIGRPAAAAVEPMIKLIQDETQPAMLRRKLVSALATVATKEQAAPVFQALVDNEEGDGDVTSMAGDMLRYIGEREAVSGNEVDPNSPEAKAAALEAEANALDAAAGK